MNIVSHFPVCVLWHLPLLYLFIPSLLQKTRKRQQPEPGTQEVPPDMGKSFFTAKMAEHWSRVPRETVGIVSFCGDTQKLFGCKHEKRALGDPASAGMLEQMTSRGRFHPSHHIPVPKQYSRTFLPAPASPGRRGEQAASPVGTGGSCRSTEPANPPKPLEFCRMLLCTAGRRRGLGKVGCQALDLLPATES